MKILIIRFSSFGDILMTTPIVRCVKKQLGAQVHFICKAQYAEILQHNPYIDKLYTIAHSYKEVWPALKKEQYDLVIDMHKSLRSRILTFRLQAQSVTFYKMTLEKWLYLTFNIDKLDSRHVIERWFEAFEPIGIHNDGEGMDLYVDPLSMIDIGRENKPRVALVLGGTYPTKRIPVQLANEITTAKDITFYLLGGNDVNVDRIKKGPNIKNYVGKISVLQAASIIDQCNLTVSGDTGLMHVSASLGKKMIVVWGSTSPKFGMFPYYANLEKMVYSSVCVEGLNCRPCSKYGRKSCPLGHMNCLNKVSANHVILEMNSMLNKQE